MHQRKLSDILIELATQGLKDPEADNYEVIHPLLWLAHVAWNREVGDIDYAVGEVKDTVAVFKIPTAILKRYLISTNWEKLLEKMRIYKRFRFPEDIRYVTHCGVTTRGTMRVEFRSSVDA